jgi:vitamin B12 transporter
MKWRHTLMCLLLCFASLSLPAQEEQDGEESKEQAPNDEKFYDEEFYDEENEDYSTVMEGSGITVTAKKQGELPALGAKETTQQIEVITKEEIEKRQAPDLPSLLEEALNLSITREGAYGNKSGVNMRGFDNTRVAVLINGIPANSSLDSGFDWSTIDLDTVERIEVIYGGSDTKYNVSGAMGGVINIITMKIQKPGLHIKGSVSNISYLPEKYTERDGSVGEPHYEELIDTQMAAVNIGYGVEHASYGLHLFGARAANHYLYENYYGYAMRKESNEVLDGGSSGSFIWELPDGYSKLMAQADFYYGNKNIPLSGTAHSTVNEEDYNIRGNLVLDMPRFFHDSFSSQFFAAYNFTDKDFEIITRSRSHDINAVNRWGWYILSNLSLNLGLDYHFIHVESARIGVNTGNQAGASLTAEYSIVKNFMLIASVKAATDLNSIIPVPKLGIAWDITDFLTFKNNYYRTFKYPDFSQLYRDEPEYFGNVNLKPEDGFGVDMGFEYRRFKWLEPGLTFFGEWTYNSINWVKYGGIWSPENVGTRTFLGADLRLDSSIDFNLGPFNKIDFSMDFQYLLSYLLTDDLNFDANLRVPYMPAYIAGGSIDISWNAGQAKTEGSLFISGHYESLRFADTTNLLPMRPYFRLNITLHQKIGKYIDVFGIIRNLFNNHYESFYDHPMPGISLTLGARFAWDSSVKEKENEK